MSTTKFLKDLKFGNDGENIVFNHLKSIDPNIKLLEKSNTGDFDFKIEINGKEITYEVKTEDQYCKPGKNTGNIFVEIKCNNKPAGIIKSKADWYVFYLPHYNQIWYIKSNTLKKLIQTKEFHLKENSGDGGLVAGYVIPRKSVRKYFKIFEV